MYTVVLQWLLQHEANHMQWHYCCGLLQHGATLLQWLCAGAGHEGSAHLNQKIGRNVHNRTWTSCSKRSACRCNHSDLRHRIMAWWLNLNSKSCHRLHRYKDILVYKSHPTKIVGGTSLWKRNREQRHSKNKDHHSSWCQSRARSPTMWISGRTKTQLLWKNRHD